MTTRDNLIRIIAEECTLLSEYGIEVLADRLIESGMIKEDCIEILCVEDGSVDLDELSENGLQDGKILVYRQGAKPPYVLKLRGGNNERQNH